MKVCRRRKFWRPANSCVTIEGVNPPPRMLLVCLLGGLLIAAQAAHAANLFRFKDENGRLVLSHTIPSERVKDGYDVVDAYGNLIERVPPQLDPEEYARKLEQDKRRTACEDMRGDVRRRYQQASDIEDALQNTLASIDRAITNAQANLALVTSQREALEAEAAQVDVSGQPVPRTLLDNIERAKAQEVNLQGSIDKLYGDKIAARERYAYERRVFLLERCDQGLPPRQAAPVDQGP